MEQRPLPYQHSLPMRTSRTWSTQDTTSGSWVSESRSPARASPEVPGLSGNFHQTVPGVPRTLPEQVPPAFARGALLWLNLNTPSYSTLRLWATSADTTSAPCTVEPRLRLRRSPVVLRASTPSILPPNEHLPILLRTIRLVPLLRRRHQDARRKHPLRQPQGVPIRIKSTTRTRVDSLPAVPSETGCTPLTNEHAPAHLIWTLRLVRRLRRHCNVQRKHPLRQPKRVSTRIKSSTRTRVDLLPVASAKSRCNLLTNEQAPVVHEFIWTIRLVPRLSRNHSDLRTLSINEHPPVLFIWTIRLVQRLRRHRSDLRIPLTNMHVPVLLPTFRPVPHPRRIFNDRCKHPPRESQRLPNSI